MQYQLILFSVNICLLAFVYFLMKNNPRQRKLVFLTTVYAYLLSVLLPYLMLWIPPRWLVLSYALAIAVALWVIDMLLFDQEENPIPLADEKEKSTNSVDMTALANRLKILSTGPEEVTSAQTGSDSSIASEAGFENNLDIQEQNSPPMPDGNVLKEADRIAPVNPTGLDLPKPEVPVIDPQETAVIELQNAFTHEDPILFQTAVQMAAAVDQDVVLLEQEPYTSEESADAEITEVPEIETLDQANIENELPVPAAEPEALSDTNLEQVEEASSGDTIADSIPEIEAAPLEIQMQLSPDLDIEQLIELGFEAKFNDEYAQAIQIFEQVLRQNPPGKVAALVLEDIEVMRLKLALI